MGKNIIRYGIELMDEIGIENFTFKKLATRMKSTEASIYRYFENKHLLLVYLVSWYWEWVRFRIDFNSMNVSDPKEKLKITIKTIVDNIRLATPADYIDRDILHRIVVKEGIKAYHINSIDEENKLGFFTPYKSLRQKIVSILKSINPDFPYPKALATNLLEMANNQMYFAEHLPKLTDIRIQTEEMKELEDLLTFFVMKLIKPA
ncbi:MAG: TetR/AcrR family transcriptional regulator [Bacteroidota bacterium]